MTPPLGDYYQLINLLSLVVVQGQKYGVLIKNRTP